MEMWTKSGRWYLRAKYHKVHRLYSNWQEGAKRAEMGLAGEHTPGLVLL